MKDRRFHDQLIWDARDFFYGLPCKGENKLVGLLVQWIENFYK